MTSPSTKKATRFLAALLLAGLAACSSLPPGGPPPAPRPASADDAIDPDKLLADDWVGSGDPAGLAAYALHYLGVPYRSGGNTPDAGFDCSGLVAYVSRAVLGLRLPRRSEDMSELGDPIAPDALRPGDLVFYDTLNRRYSHVGIYLGHGRFVHSPSSGGVVRIESMTTEYWRKRFDGARRLMASR